METSTRTANWLLGLIGAAGGGAVGFYLFKLLLGQGLYGLAIPGAMLGLGSALLSGGRSQALGIVCGLLALGLSLFTEWHCFPFIDDDSFGYFLTHVYELKLWTVIMLAVGTAAGYWFGQGREPSA